MSTQPPSRPPRRPRPAHRAARDPADVPTLRALLDAALARARWTLEDLAAAIDVPSQHLRAVLRGDWPMSPPIAARSEYVLGAPGLAEDLLVAQALHEVAAARADVAEADAAARAAGQAARL